MKKLTHITFATLFAALLFMIGCDLQQTAITEADSGSDLGDVSLLVDPAIVGAAKSSSPDVSPYLARINENLAARGIAIAIHKAEWIGDGSEHPASNKIIFANDRTKRLNSQWVSGDERGAVPEGDNLSYTVFSPLATANGSIPAESILDAGYASWLNQTTCSTLDLVKRSYAGVLPSAILSSGGVAGDPFIADISEIGFLPGSLFDAVLGPEASSSVLGVTFTSIWLDGPGGNPTDVNNDGYADVALKEIWYNDAFNWSTDGSDGIEILTVAKHEQGHALGFGHFGRLSFDNKTGKLQASPRALMNAGYLGPYPTIKGTDEASFCGIYGSWPN